MRKLICLLFSGSILYCTDSLGQCEDANAGANRSITCGNSTTLGSTYNSNYTYVWSPATGLNAPTSYNPSATPTQTTTYTLTMIPQPNLLQNGDFESGNAFFSSDYSFGLSGGNTLAYTVGSSASAIYSWWCGTQPASPSNMLIADGPLTSGQRVWYQTITVTPSTVYSFSGQFLNLYNTNAYNQNDPGIEVRVNGKLIASQLLPFNSCNWETISGIWTSGPTATTATIAIYANPSVADNIGNDFAIDNLVFTTSECLITTSQVTVTVNKATISADLNSGETTQSVYQHSSNEVVSCDWVESIQKIDITTSLSSNINWFVNGILLTDGMFPGPTIITAQTISITGVAWFAVLSSVVVATQTTTGCTTDPLKIIFSPSAPHAMVYSPINGVYTAETTNFGGNTTYYWTVNDVNTSYITARNNPTVQFSFPSGYNPPAIFYFGYPWQWASTSVTVNLANPPYSCITTTADSWYDLSKRKVETFQNGITRETNTDIISIYPNPATRSVAVRTIQPFTKIQLYASDGSIKKLHTQPGTNALIDVSNLNPGVYFITIISPKSIRTEKLIVVK